MTSKPQNRKRIRLAGKIELTLGISLTPKRNAKETSKREKGEEDEKRIAEKSRERKERQNTRRCPPPSSPQFAQTHEILAQIQLTSRKEVIITISKRKLMARAKRHVLEKLEIRLEYERSQEFYACQTPGCRRFTFEESFELLFKCLACNKPMMRINNELTVEILTRKIEQIKAL